MKPLLSVTEDMTEDELDERMFAWLGLEMAVEIERRDLRFFIEDAVALDRMDLCAHFLAMMEEEVPHHDEMPYLAWILTLDLSDDALDALAQEFDPEFYDMVSAFLYAINEEHIALGIRNIRHIFKGVELDRTALELLYSKAREKGLIQLTNYLTGELEQEKDDYAIVPEWIIPGKRSHHDLAAELEVPILERWISESVEADAAYLASLVEEDKDIEDVLEQLVLRLSYQTKYDRELMISTLIKQNTLMLLSRDPEIFRVLGPCLPMGEAFAMRLSSRDPCNMYGGCRVYTCHENENIDKNTAEAIIERPVTTGRLAELEWFTGRCMNEECKLLIQKKCHALRMPVPEEGGWVGCYCSFFCLRQVAGDSSDVLTNLLAGFEGQYLAYGIYDRDD